MNQGQYAASHYTHGCSQYQSNIEAHELKHSLWIRVCSARQGTSGVFGTAKKFEVLLEHVVDDLSSVLVIECF